MVYIPGKCEAREFPMAGSGDTLTEMANSKDVHFHTVTVSRRSLMSVYGFLEVMEMCFLNSTE